MSLVAEHAPAQVVDTAPGTVAPADAVDSPHASALVSAPAAAPRRTAYVLKVYPRFSETFVVTEILAREARGEDLEIFALRPTTDSRFHPELARVKAPVTHLGRPTKVSEAWELHAAAVARIPGFAERYAALLPDIAQDEAADVHQALDLAARVCERGITHLHAHFGSAAGRVAELAARMAGIDYSVTTHAKDLFHESVDPARLRRLIAGSHHLVTISDYNLSHLRREFPDLAHKIVLAYNGLELARFPYRAPRPVPAAGHTAEAPLRIAAVGRLVEKKGFSELVEAARRLTAEGLALDVRIAGDGDLRADLQERIDRAGLTGVVTLLGARTQEEIRTLLDAADVFCAPCVVGTDGNADGLPTVLLEAMAMGVPCIASAVTGIPEVVDGTTGVLHAPGDTEALVAGLRAFASGEIDRESMARAARALVEDRFDSHRQAAALAALEDAPARSPQPLSVPRDLDGRRIAYVSVDPGIPVFGTKGASVHVQEIVRELRARGARVDVFATRAGENRPADLADVHLVHTPIATKEPAAREVAQQDASAGIAQRIVAGEYDLVYERYSLFSTCLADCAEAGIPGVLEVNAPLIDEQRTHRDLVDGAAAAAALRAQARAAVRTVCVSRPVADWVEQHTGVPALVVPNGVNTQRVTPGVQTFDPHAPLVVAFVGTLKPWHGVDVLVDAVAASTGTWTVRIIGDGPMGEQLRARVAGLGEAVASRISFTGAVPPAAVPALLASCTAAVAPYPEVAAEDSYFSPLKIYEYLAAGLPVVASAIGQIPSVLGGTGAGELVAASDVR
ncbi:glycosyltransferase, partial [Brevibacterium samyangense]